MSKRLKISYDWRGMSIEFKLQDKENSSDWTGTILHKWGKVLSYSLRSPRKGNTMASGVLDYAGV